jgi:hypothetical protein
LQLVQRRRRGENTHRRRGNTGGHAKSRSVSIVGGSVQLLTECSRRPSRPTLKGIGECADIPISEQPGNLGNWQALVCEMTLGQIASQSLPHAREPEPFRPKASRKGLLAQPQPPRDFARLCLTARHEQGNLILDSWRKRSLTDYSVCQSFFAIFDQELVKVRITTDHCHVANRWRKYRFVNVAAESDLASKECAQFTARLASMDEADTIRDQTSIGNLPAYPNERRDPKLDLMLV